MVEIAISLAIIGIALVSIIGVLPIGMHTQRDNREETLINQDATVFMEAIRGGARGLDDLTNYVFAITNYWGQYANGNTNHLGANGYTFASFYIAPNYVTPNSGVPLTNGMNIIGLLSTPEYTDLNGLPIPSLLNGGYSNHVVAYVRSLSGPAVEKPPQTNGLVVGDSFGYLILCVNAPVAVDTNLFNLHPLWLNTVPYGPGDVVFYNFAYWQAAVPNTGSTPGQSANWVKFPVYGLELGSNLRELRLTFMWPLLPNNSLPGDFKRQSFRALIAGQVATNIVAGQFLYFYQSGTFAATP